MDNVNGLKKQYVFILVIAVLVVSFGVSYFSPYLMIYYFCEAATKKQVVSLNNLVDFPVLKENLKVQALSSMGNQLQGDPNQQNNSFGVLGLAFQDWVVNTTTDTLTDPAVFDAQVFSKIPANLSPLQIFANMMANMQGIYESADSFVIQPKNMADGTQPKISLVLGRTGPFSWKLNNIKVEEPSTTTVAQQNTPVVQNESTSNNDTSNTAPSSELASDTTPEDSANKKNVATIIEQVLQEECKGNDSAIDSALPDLERVQKPALGDSAEANRLNKAGLKCLKEKNFSEAVKFFGWAANADPSDPKYLSNLGFAEMHNGDLDSAKMHLYQSIAIAPSRQTAWGDLGENFARQGDQEKAVACFLIGYKISGGDTLGYLKSLKDDDNPAVVKAGSIAVGRLQIVNSLKP